MKAGMRAPVHMAASSLREKTTPAACEWPPSNRLSVELDGLDRDTLPLISSHTIHVKMLTSSGSTWTVATYKKVPAEKSMRIPVDDSRGEDAPNCEVVSTKDEDSRSREIHM